MNTSTDVKMDIMEPDRVCSGADEEGREINIDIDVIGKSVFLGIIMNRVVMQQINRT